MNHSLRKALALLMALLIAMPTFAFAEGPADGTVVLDDSIEIIDEEQQVSSDAIEPPAEEAGALLLDDIASEYSDDAAGSETAAPEDAAALVERVVSVDGATFRVTSAVGAFPEDAALRVMPWEDAGIAEAVEAAFVAEGVYTHRQYSLELLDSAENVILPSLEQGVPAVRVEGLGLPAEARVAAYDEGMQGVYEIDAAVWPEEDAITFDFMGAAVYDLFTIEPLTEQEEAPAEEEPAGEETEEPAIELSEGGIEQPAEESAEGETEEPAEEPAAFEAASAFSEGVVTVTAEPGVFPEGAVLIVSEAAPMDSDLIAKSAPTETVVASYAYDITVTDAEGNPVQPAEGTTATVAFQLAEANDPNLSVRVLHETADGQEALNAYTADGAVIAETTGFSRYTVEFYYNLKEYVLPGDSPVVLSEILVVEGLTGEVTDVAVSDEGLFSVSNETGEWVLTAHQAFSTTEWMVVTIGGIPYEITVTDAATVSVTYIERGWNGSAVSETSKTRDVPSVPSDGKLTQGWYYLGSDVTVNGRVLLTGDTNLILGDGYTLTVDGLYIPEGKTLTIYGQSGGTGILRSDPSEGTAIGGYSKHSNGNIVIHGGTIDANGGGECAGIGGNSSQPSGSITIYGGTVTAKGSKNGAAIGSGADGTHGGITIYGGTVTADNSDYENGAGIGGGNNADGGTINIYGGTITTWSRDGAGIGGGEDGEAGDITISGGDITCWDKGEANGARIGSGNSARNDNKNGKITITGGTIYTYHRDGAGIGGGDNADGGLITISGGEIHATYADGSSGNGAAIGGSHNQGAGGPIRITGGEISAHSKYGAGIGGGLAAIQSSQAYSQDSGASGSVQITGGKVWAKSDYAFGIGAGGSGFSYGGGAHDDMAWYYKNIGNCYITIEGDADVETYGGQAGIGGDGGHVTIKGGTVTASGNGDKGFDGGCGIYIFSQGTHGTIDISGGEIHANGLDNFPGISVEHGEVNITGGRVYAHSVNGGGLGAFDDNDCESTVMTITGANTFVQAKSDKAAGFAIKDWDDGTWTFDQATIEVISGGKLSNTVPVFYEGSMVKAGASESSTKYLDYKEREDAHKTYKYWKIEPCTHDYDAAGKCVRCGDQQFPIKYVDHSWNDSVGTLTTSENDSDGSTVVFPRRDNTTLPGGWYYVNENITLSKRLELQGDTRLILGDGYTLTVNGLYIPEGKTLTIYAQSDGTKAGKLISKPTDGGAGIGGYSGHNNGDIIIHGGVITAVGDDHCAGIGSNDGKTTGAITIYGGTVNATGGSNSAGIGGGRYSNAGSIAIYDGTVTATGKDDAACIGGGEGGEGQGNASEIKICGGTVTATASGKGAAIGGGDYGTTNLSITGGQVKATAENGTGIGGGSKLSTDNSAIILGYTDTSRDDISITASSYSGKVTFEQRFVNKNGNYSVGSAADPAKLAGSTLRAWDGTSETWADLQQTIRGAANGSTIVLDQDYTALDSDVALYVPADRTLTIDLNGFTLDRGLSDKAAKDYGYVFSVSTGAKVTIRDSLADGKITGGNTSGDVGGIQNNGTLTLENVTITGNKCTGSGGGVYNSGTLTVKSGATITGNSTENYSGGGIYNGGTLNLNGGSITGNTSGMQGGGILQNGTMNISSAPVVKNNTATTNGNNIYLRNDHPTMAVTDEMIYGAEVWVTSARGIAPITTGYGAKNGSDPATAFFRSDNANYGIFQKNGEVNIVARFNVTVNKGDAATLEVDKTNPAEGETVTVTVKDDTPPVMVGVTYTEDSKIISVPFTPGEGQTGTFVMPGADATVELTYNALTTNYIDASGSEASADATPLKAGQTELTGTNRFYVVNRNLSLGTRLKIKGSVNLILADGCTLNANGGIELLEGNSLTVYGQSEGTGALVAKGSEYKAGIGGTNTHSTGTFTLYGGVVKANGGGRGAGIGGAGNSSGGTINIHGGTVTAQGGAGAAGIGGGYSGSGGRITISGGTVTATGGDDAAGIGGGDGGSASSGGGSGGTITISGGTVTAMSGCLAAGIGGGRYSSGGTITISGGTVTVISSDRWTNGPGAGIGTGGDDYTGSTTITISGGKVTANGARGSAGIGHGRNNGNNAVNITLTYTDDTREAISVTADAFSGTVTLLQGFFNENGEYSIYSTYSGADLNQLAGSALRAWGGTVKTWAQLQQAIDDAKSGSTIVLDQNYRALSADSALKVTGKTLTLDLNGFTLDRDLANGAAKENGYVLSVAQGATLTIKDSDGSGSITGGNTDGDAGGILNAGTLTLEGGSITGNQCTASGGGIRNAGTGVLNVRGGAITGNTAANYSGGGIYNGGTLNLSGGAITGNQANGAESQGGGILNNGTMNVSGNPSVSDNTCASGPNIYLRGDHPTMTVTGKLTDGANLYVTKAGDGTGPITRGYASFNDTHPDAFFHADNATYGMMQINGEAHIGVPIRGVEYVSYAWKDGQLEATSSTTDDGKWMLWPEGTSIPGAMYVVNSNVTLNERLMLEGDTSILLVNGKTLTVNGLYIPEGSTLTIYGQSGDTGKLISHPTGGGAAIGGYSGHSSGSVVIHGGTIDAVGDDNCAGIGSNDSQTSGWITIYHGNVTATGGSNGAGIGGGKNASSRGRRIVIFGGDIKATGGRNGAGIGGGQNGPGGTIMIYGGNITAEGTDSAAGIGGGDPSDSTATDAAVMIYGGTVTAIAHSKGAGIGGGEYGRGSIEIYGGKVTATGGESGGAGIGSGYDGPASSIHISGGEVEAKTTSDKAVGMGDRKNKASTMTFSYTDETRDGIRIKSPSYGGSIVTESDFTTLEGGELFFPDTYTDTTAMAGKTLVKFEKIAVEYLDLDGNTQTAECVLVTQSLTTWKDGWYAINASVDIPGGVTVLGKVDLVLVNGCTLNTSNVAVANGNTFTIWGQENATGKLVARSTDYSKAGIGGADSDCGTITINGCVIDATGTDKHVGGDGTYSSAGIGAAYDKNAGRIIINGGDVTAKGGKQSAGIGGAAPTYYVKGSRSGVVEIHGGKVTAYGNDGSAGIGSGYCRNDYFQGLGSILITGGEVTAYGSVFKPYYDQYRGLVGAGIGGSWDSSVGSITITGGKVTAYAASYTYDGNDLSNDSAAIGLGNFINGQVTQEIQASLKTAITITGGEVKAYGGAKDKGAAAIGGANRSVPLEIKITGGQITATGGYVGIGKGTEGSDCTTTLSWTDEDKDTMFVQADSYNGTVTLEKPFRSRTDGTSFAEGDYSGDALEPLNGKTLVPGSVVYTVTFDSNGGSAVEAQTVNPGEQATQPADPRWYGHTFKGWQLDGEDYGFAPPP